MTHLFHAFLIFKIETNYYSIAYQSANSLPASGNQVCIYTPRLTNKLFMKVVGWVLLRVQGAF